jgi:hypothetical protein
MKIILTEKQLEFLVKKLNNNKILKESYNQDTIITEASKKKILMDKVGLNEENAEYLEKVCGSLSVWMANKLIDLQLKNMRSWIGFDESELTKEEAIKRLNSNNIRNYYGQTVTEIMDWIRIGLNGNVSEYKNLTIPELQIEANDWHKSLGVGNGDINYKEKGNIVLDFRNGSDEGFYWINTGTNICDEESKRMGHCGKTLNNSTIWSLRKDKKIKNGYTINNSVVTAAIGVNDGLIWQMKGPKNSKPKKEFYKYIIPLLYFTDENGYVIKGFTDGYNSRYDFQIRDLELSEIKELYQNRPDLFDNYKTKRLLVDLGIVDKSVIDDSFIVRISPDNLGRYFKGGNLWGPKTAYFKKMITEPRVFWDNWGYYNPEDLMSEIDEKNLKLIIKMLSDQNEVNLRDIPIDELLEYDNGNVEDCIRYAANKVDSDAYSEYLYRVLKSTLETFGKVISINSEGVEIEVSVDIFDDIENVYIQNYMETCEYDPECVFIKLVYQGNIELPEPIFDENWNNSNFDTRDFNKSLLDNLQEYL